MSEPKWKGWMDSVGDILPDLRREIDGADVRYGPFRSSHEGLGVLTEEVTELTEAIRQNDLAQIQREALQVSAVALRIVLSMRSPLTRKRSGCGD